MNIYIAGDSTASIKENNKRPETGWGEKLNIFFCENVSIINKAQNGRSTKSFIAEKKLDEIANLIKKDDFLIIQFGHNDEKIDNPERYANKLDYKNNLKQFIKAAKNKGATPIILTSVSRRKFLEDKKTIDPLAIGNYPSYALEVAKEENVLHIDIFNRSKKLYEILGYEKSKKLFLKLKPFTNDNYLEGIDDNTHFNDLGALIIASLIAEELSKLKIERFNNNIKQNEILTIKEIITKI